MGGRALVGCTALGCMGEVASLGGTGLRTEIGTRVGTIEVVGAV